MEVWHYAFAFPSLEYKDNAPAPHRDTPLDLLFGRKEAFVVLTLEHCLHIFGSFCYGNFICTCTLNFQEYVKGISSTGMQSNCGFEGQINACWTHKVTTKELDTIRAAGFLVSVIHGRLVLKYPEQYTSISQNLHA